jgi:hypothetical protein
MKIETATCQRACDNMETLPRSMETLRSSPVSPFVTFAELSDLRAQNEANQGIPNFFLPIVNREGEEIYERINQSPSSCPGSPLITVQELAAIAKRDCVNTSTNFEKLSVDYSVASEWHSILDNQYDIKSPLRISGSPSSSFALPVRAGIMSKHSDSLTYDGFVAELAEASKIETLNDTLVNSTLFDTQVRAESARLAAVIELGRKSSSVSIGEVRSITPKSEEELQLISGDENESPNEAAEIAWLRQQLEGEEKKPVDAASLDEEWSLDSVFARTAAAMTLQSVYRGHLHRRWVAIERRRQLWQKECLSAIKIQVVHYKSI